MSTPIDMKEIEKRAYRATLQDGIMEMYLGLFLGFYAGACNAASTYFKTEFPIMPFALFFMFSAIIIELIRRRLTYPRVGYAKIDPKIRPVFALVVIVPLCIFPLFLAIAARFFADTWNLDPWLKWSPAFLGIVFGCLFYSVAIRSGNAFYYAFLVLSVISGISLSLIRFSPARTGMMVFLLGMGGLLLLYGVTVLIQFLRKYPKPTKEVSNVNAN